MRIITSANFKIPTTIYDIIEHEFFSERRKFSEPHVKIKVYWNTDVAQRYRVFKADGQEAKELLKAKDSIKQIPGWCRSYEW